MRLGVYQTKDMRLDLNWTPVHGEVVELAQGINIIHSPGHTPGLCILQVNLRESGTWIFTSDQYHVRENYEASVPQGWLARDHEAWIRSHQKIKSLVKRTEANLILGHCMEVSPMSSLDSVLTNVDLQSIQTSTRALPVRLPTYKEQDCTQAYIIR